MSEEDIKPDEEIKETPVKSEKAKPAKANDGEGVGLRTVLFSSAIAAILGISGGTYFGGMAGQHEELEIRDYSQEISEAQKEVATLTAKLNRLEQQVETLGKETPTSVSGDFDNSLFVAQNEAIEDLTNRLTTLEKRPNPQPALQNGEGNDDAISVYNDVILSRLEALEGREYMVTEPVNLKPIKTRIDRLEKRLSDLPSVLPPFPRDAVLKALEDAKANEPKGWFARTFGGQMVVQDADILARLNRIEENVALQNISAIKSDIASLPESVQETLGPWLEQVEKTGNSK